MTWEWFLQPLQLWEQLPWLTMCPLEIIATIFGLWSVICYVRESPWSWPTGLINVAAIDRLLGPLADASPIAAQTRLTAEYTGATP